MKVVDVPAGARTWTSGRVQWLEAEEGITVEAVELSGEYPETELVVVFTCFRDPGYEGCRFRLHYPLWADNGQRLDDRQLLGFNFQEWLGNLLPKPDACRPGTIDL